jgi:hypothetical protein
MPDQSECNALIGMWAARRFRQLRPEANDDDWRAVLVATYDVLEEICKSKDSPIARVEEFLDLEEAVSE